jgi:hypothetical protein
MIGVEESNMRRGLLDGLVIATGGVLGFVLTFSGFVLWIRLHEAHYPAPAGVGRVYGIFLPSFAGFLIGALAAVLVRFRHRGCRNALLMPPVD